MDMLVSPAGGGLSGGSVTIWALTEYKPLAKVEDNAINTRIYLHVYSVHLRRDFFTDTISYFCGNAVDACILCAV